MREKRRMATEPTIPPTRFPRVRTVLILSAAVRKWLIEQAKDEAAREGGRPSMSAILERIVRESASRN